MSTPEQQTASESPAAPVAASTLVDSETAPTTESTSAAPAKPASDTANSTAPAPVTDQTKEESPKAQPQEQAGNKSEEAADGSPIAQLWAVAKAHGHPEIWGVTLADPDQHVPTRIILQKYLNANDGDLPKAKDQLFKTLDWRAKTKPLDLIKKSFNKAKFDGLGYVTKYQQEGSTEPEGKEVFTWNIYGAVKSMEDTFGKLDEYGSFTPFLL